MRRLLFWGAVASGAVAAILMYKRGETLGTIAKQVPAHPIQSLVGELRSA